MCGGQLLNIAETPVIGVSLGRRGGCDSSSSAPCSTYSTHVFAMYVVRTVDYVLISSSTTFLNVEVGRVGHIPSLGYDHLDGGIAIGT